MYDSAAEFNQKLSSCVVFKANRPVWIAEASGQGKKILLTFKDLRDQKMSQDLAFSDDWDFRTLGSRLGYSNLDLGPESYQEALYLTRIAVRMCSNTQGLSQRNIKIPLFKGSSKLGLPRDGISWNSLHQSKAFLDTLERKYPSVEEVAKNMTKNKRLCSMAFDPKFAVSRPDVGPFYLDYRGKNIGYSEDFSKWKIAPEYDHLHETLEHIQLKIT